MNVRMREQSLSLASPWQAFFRGMLVVSLTWTGWSCGRSSGGGSGDPLRPNHTPIEESERNGETRNSSGRGLDQVEGFPEFSWMVSTNHNQNHNLYYLHSRSGDQPHLKITPIAMQSYPELAGYQYKRQATVTPATAGGDDLYVSFVAEDISQSVLSGEHLMIALLEPESSRQTVPQSIYYDALRGRIYDQTFVASKMLSSQGTHTGSTEPTESKLVAMIDTDDGLQLLRYSASTFDDTQVFEEAGENQPSLFTLDKQIQIKPSTGLRNGGNLAASFNKEGTHAFTWEGEKGLITSLSLSTVVSSPLNSFNTTSASASNSHSLSDQCRYPLPIQETSISNGGFAMLYYCPLEGELREEEQGDQPGNLCRLQLDIVRKDQPQFSAKLLIDERTACHVFAPMRPAMILGNKEDIHIVYQKGGAGASQLMHVIHVISGTGDERGSEESGALQAPSMKPVELARHDGQYSYLQLASSKSGVVFLSFVLGNHLQVAKLGRPDEVHRRMQEVTTYLTFGTDLPGLLFDIGDFKIRGDK